MLDFTKSELQKYYETMLKIRYFEENVEKHFLAGDIPGFVHLYIGEEAVATGVCAHLDNEDYIESTHRGHGHTIAKGANLDKMMAEIYGKKTGLCKGKGGSMHIADFSVGMLGANGVVGGGFNLAVGAALAIKMKEEKRVSVVFFGDGASNRGTFHEAANMASIWKLPVIFVNENNEWASTTPTHTMTSVQNISERAIGYSMHGITVNGNDFFEVYDAMKEAKERALQGGGPTILECKTYRIKGHFVGDPEMYRTKEEVKERFLNDDPIKNFEERVLAENLMTIEEIEEMKEKVLKIVDDSLKFALDSEYPDESELYTDIYV